jgi:hypothetical protein
VSDPRLPFKHAQVFVIHFGKYKGKTIDDIARTDDGLLYLDWLCGELGHTTDPIKAVLRTHLHNYLRDPTINRDLCAIARGRKGD